MAPAPPATAPDLSALIDRFRAGDPGPSSPAVYVAGVWVGTRLRAVGDVVAFTRSDDAMAHIFATGQLPPGPFRYHRRPEGQS